MVRIIEKDQEGLNTERLLEETATRGLTDIIEAELRLRLAGEVGIPLPPAAEELLEARLKQVQKPSLKGGTTMIQAREERHEGSKEPTKPGIPDSGPKTKPAVSTSLDEALGITSEALADRRRADARALELARAQAEATPGTREYKILVDLKKKAREQEYDSQQRAVKWIEGQVIENFRKFDKQSKKLKPGTPEATALNQEALRVLQGLAQRVVNLIDGPATVTANVRGRAVTFDNPRYLRVDSPKKITKYKEHKLIAAGAGAGGWRGQYGVFLDGLNEFLVNSGKRRFVGRLGQTVLVGLLGYSAINIANSAVSDYQDNRKIDFSVSNADTFDKHMELVAELVHQGRVGLEEAYQDYVVKLFEANPSAVPMTPEEFETWVTETPAPTEQQDGVRLMKAEWQNRPHTIEEALDVLVEFKNQTTEPERKAFLWSIKIRADFNQSTFANLVSQALERGLITQQSAYELAPTLRATERAAEVRVTVEMVTANLDYFKGMPWVEGDTPQQIYQSFLDKFVPKATEAGYTSMEFNPELARLQAKKGNKTFYFEPRTGVVGEGQGALLDQADFDDGWMRYLGAVTSTAEEEIEVYVDRNKTQRLVISSEDFIPGSSGLQIRGLVSSSRTDNIRWPDELLNDPNKMNILTAMMIKEFDALGANLRGTVIDLDVLAHNYNFFAGPIVTRSGIESLTDKSAGVVVPNENGLMVKVAFKKREEPGKAGFSSFGTFLAMLYWHFTGDNSLDSPIVVGEISGRIGSALWNADNTLTMVSD